MATRTLNVQITGDARGINRVLDQTESRTKRWGGKMAAGFAVAGAAAAGGLAVGLKKSAEAAIESEKSAARLETQLNALGINFAKHRGEIDRVIQSHSKLSGLDDEDLQDAFTNIVRVTGDVDRSLRLTGLAADFARAKHMDVAKAGELVGKVAGGNTGILSRYGITVKEGASAQEALALLQQKFAGQAEAYGKTTAGALDRAGVASENLGEIVGTKLTPWLAKGATALVNLVDKSGSLAGPIRTATGSVRRSYEDVADAVQRFVRRNRGDIDDVIEAAQKLGRFIKAVFLDVIVPVVKRVVPIIADELKGIITAIRGLVRVVSGIINGDWTQVWNGVKDIVRGSLRALTAMIRGVGGILKDAMVALGKLLVRGIVSGISGLATAVKTAVVNGVKKGVGAAGSVLKDAAGALNPFFNALGKGAGDGIGRAVAPALPQGGAFGGSLMGANSALRPFAAIGARFGNVVSSGLRPGAITSSGNPSYHGSGEALDQSGSPAGMLNYARFLASRFGGRLAELIHTPLGFSIQNGRKTAPIAQADHYDHVHVALDLGRPGVGIGDGLGKFDSTSYGPPWNAMNGTGVTATGVDLRPAKKAYGIAVDPSKLKLGRSYYAWPNPFGHRGAFKAFDTGGAIKGNRIDFYDWRGRQAQMGWGTKTVSISTTPFSGGGGNMGASGGSTFRPGSGSAGPSGPNTAAGVGSTSAGGGSEGLTGPGGGGFEQRVANTERRQARAERNDNLGALLKALKAERRLKRRRLRKINKTLKRRLRKATRLRLTQEAAQLESEIGDLNETIKEYAADKAGGAKTITEAEGLDAGKDPNAETADDTAADTAADAGGGAAEPDPAIEEQNRLIAENNALIAEDIALKKRIATLVETQSPQITAGVVAMISGSIGGSFGISAQSVGVPGQLARY